MPTSILLPDEYIHSPDNLTVWLFPSIPATNVSKQDTKVIARNVTDLYYHPKYLSSKLIYGKDDYDIALLTLKEPIQFNSITGISPVCIPTKVLKDDNLIGLETFVFSFEISSFPSFIYPRMRCRVNSERKWISDRFLCSVAPPLAQGKYFKPGGAVTTRGKNGITQIGIHSWTTYFPQLSQKKPLFLSTNVAGFLDKIDSYSEAKGAQWCKNPINISVPTKHSATFNAQFINERIDKENSSAWNNLQSISRDVRKTCKCGLVNSQGLAKGKIQGGSNASPYEYGWLVQLISQYEDGNEKIGQLCGGTIVNSRVIVTAAHCLFMGRDGEKHEGHKVKPENLQVRASRYYGPRHHDDNSFVATVQAVIPHPEFESEHLIKNDIALIILSGPLDFIKLKGKVSPICFPELGENLTVDDRNDTRVIGWGRTEATKEGSHSKLLEELQEKTISQSECYKILDTYRGVGIRYKLILSDNKRICAGNFLPVKNYKDATRGDSGGPLFMPITEGANTMIQIGVASLITMASLIEYGLTEDIETVTFYTRAQSYIKFVDYYSMIDF